MVVKTRKKYNGGRYTRKMNGGSGRDSKRQKKSGSFNPLGTPPLMRRATVPDPGGTAGRVAGARGRGKPQIRLSADAPPAVKAAVLSTRNQEKLKELFDAYVAAKARIDDLDQKAQTAETMAQGASAMVDVCSVAAIGRFAMAIKEIGTPALAWVSQNIQPDDVLTSVLQLVNSFRDVPMSTSRIFGNLMYEMISSIPTYPGAMGLGALLFLTIAKRKQLINMFGQKVKDGLRVTGESAAKLVAAADKLRKVSGGIGGGIVAQLVTQINTNSVEGNMEDLLFNTLALVEIAASITPGNKNLKIYLREIIEIFASDPAFRDALNVTVESTKREFAEIMHKSGEVPIDIPEQCYGMGARVARDDLSTLGAAADRASSAPFTLAAKQMLQSRKYADETERRRKKEQKKYETAAANSLKRLAAMQEKAGRSSRSTKAILSQYSSKMSKGMSAVPAVPAGASALGVAPDVDMSAGPAEPFDAAKHQQLVESGRRKREGKQTKAEAEAMELDKIANAMAGKSASVDAEGAGAASVRKAKGSKKKKKGGRRTRKRRKSRKGGYKYKKRKSKKRRN